jgi:glycosyltransferase involved in cell wall biosynthesis
MHLLIDGRTFSLQQKGGVSQLWSKLLDSFCFQDLFRISIFLYPGHEKNIHLAESKILENKSIEKIFCNIPPSDNFNYSNKESSKMRQEFISSATKTNLPDIVLNTYYGENIFPDCRRYMIVVHDFAHEDLVVLRTKQTTNDVVKRKVESLESATDIVYISSFTRKRAYDLYPHIMNVKNRVIYHGHDELSFRPIKKKGQFVHIGTRSGYKNFEIVAKVFSKILKVNSAISLLIVGGEAVDALTKDLLNNFPDQVVFCTDVSDDIILTYLASSDAYISASYYEGFGIPVLNALYTETQLILSDIPVYKEIASHFAHFFDPTDDQQLEEHVYKIFHSNSLNVPRCDRSWERVSNDYASFILSESSI